MDDNGFAYVFRGVWLLILAMVVWHGGNAIIALLPPVEDYIHRFVLLGMLLHVVPLLLWIYLQSIDPVLASIAPGMAQSPDAALRIEERAGRYGSFVLLPYPKLFFGILLGVLRSVAKFLYHHMAFDFEKTVLHQAPIYRRTIRFRNYIRSTRGQTPLPATQKGRRTQKHPHLRP